MERSDLELFLDIGVSYRFVTPTGIFVGEVIRFGDTSLIIRKADQGKMLVKYDVITEVEEVVEGAAVTLTAPAVTPSPVLPVQAGGIGTMSPGNTPLPGAEIERMIQEANRKVVPGVIEMPAYSAPMIRQLFRAEPVVPRGWADVFSVFNSARKNHAFTEKRPKIERMVKDIFQSHGECRALCVFWGYILLEAGETLQAAEAFCRGGDFLAEASLRQTLKQYDKLAWAVKDYMDGTEDFDPNLWNTMVFYAVQTGHGRMVLDYLDRRPSLWTEDAVLSGLYYIISQYQRTYLLTGDNYLKSAEIMAGLRPVLQEEPGRDPERQPLPLVVSGKKPEPAAALQQESPVQKTVQQPVQPAAPEGESTHEGVITFFKFGGRYGFINNTQYFHIRQVADYNLRMFLLYGKGVGIEVEYTYGRNYREEKAANAIRPIRELALDMDALMQPIHEGFISEYYPFGGNYGKVSNPGSGRVKDIATGMQYYFEPSAIVDKNLRKKIEESFNPEEMDVLFTLSKEGKGGYVERMALSRDLLKTDILLDPGYKELPKWRESDSKPVPALDPAPVPPGEAEPVPVSVIASVQAMKEKMTAKQYEDHYVMVDEEVREACNILYSPDLPNPFEKMPTLHGNGNYYKAVRYSTGVKAPDGSLMGLDLEKAEEFYIRSLQADEQVESAVSGLASLYLRMGSDKVIKGLQLLDVYGIYLNSERQLDLRVQLIDKSGNEEALLKILKYAVKQSVKDNKRIHYWSQLMRIYYLKGDWKETLKCAETIRGLIEKNAYLYKSSDVRRRMLANAVRMIAICQYQMGDTETAKRTAARLLELSENDLVASLIQTDRFVLDEYQDGSPEIAGELEGLYDLSNRTTFVNYLLETTDISTLFSRMKQVSGHIRDKRYVGSNQELKRDIEDITKKLANNIAVTPLNRSDFMLGLAKIALEARERDDGIDAVSVEQINTYIGRSMLFRGDDSLRTKEYIDVTRHYYIQALYYMRKDETSNIVNALNRLVYSFFLDQTELSEELSRRKRNPQYEINRYFDRRCISIKDLLHTAFILSGSAGDYEHLIREALYQHAELAKRTQEYCQHAVGRPVEVRNKYEFETLWREARSIFEADQAELIRRIRSCISDNEMHEKMVANIDHIRQLQEKHFLFNLDEDLLQMFLFGVEELERTKAKENVSEAEDGYNNVITMQRSLQSQIEINPTDLGFNVIREVSDQLIHIAEDKLNELYGTTKPELPEIQLLSDSVYVKENNLVQLTILFENANFKQTADGVDVKVIPGIGVELKERVKTFGSIRSGEREEYIAVFRISPEIIETGQFDIDVEISYQYHSRINEIEGGQNRVKLNVNLSSRGTFVPIENRYDKILRASSVTVPDMFKGREELIQSICDSLSVGDGEVVHNRGIILWGQRRVGKNSVKDYLKKRIEETYPGVYIPIELGSIGNSHTLSEVLGSLIDATEDVLMNGYPELYEYYCEADLADFSIDVINSENYMFMFKRYMIRFAGVLKKANPERPLIPLYYIDEFSYLYQWIEEGHLDGTVFMRFWKSFIQDYNVCAIIIAQDNIPVWSNKYPNEFSCMNYDNEITYLGKKGARELICDPCRLNGASRFMDDAVEYIHSLTRGSAYLIVILCKAIIDYLNETYTEKVTRAVVEIVLDRGLVSGDTIFEKRDFEPQIADVTMVGDAALRMIEENTRLLTEIAKNTANTQKAAISSITYLSDHSEEHRKVFGRLKERKIITAEGDRYCYINLPLLKLFLLKENGVLTKEALQFI